MKSTKIFGQVEQIEIEDMEQQAQGYLGLEGIGNVHEALPENLQVSDLQNLAGGGAKEIVNFHDRFFSDMIYKAIEGSIKNIT